MNRAGRGVHITTTAVFPAEAGKLSHQGDGNYQFSKSHPKFTALKSQGAGTGRCPEVPTSACRLPT